MDLYRRKVRLTATGNGGKLILNPGGFEDDAIKIAFSISKSLSSTQNDGTIEIWNLSESSRNALGRELDNILLEAGYMPFGGESNVGTICNGQLRDVEHRRDGPDIVTTLTFGEGDKAFRKATIAKTYKAGTEVKEVVDDIYKQLEKEGITRGEMKFPDGVAPFKRPYTVCGSCKREMDQLSRGKDFHWSVQNGTMEVIPGDGFIGGVVILSAQSGMIDTPTITDNGVKVRALLDPAIRPNRRVRVLSEVLEMNAENKEYRVSECSYAGDNRDGDFLVSLTGESIKGGKVDEGTWKDKK